MKPAKQVAIARRAGTPSEALFRGGELVGGANAGQLGSRALRRQVQRQTKRAARQEAKR